MEPQPELGKRLYGKRPLRLWCGGVSALVLLLWGFSAAADVSSTELFPIPDALRSSVSFWKKIFAEVEVTGGLLHDMKDPAIIYETLQQLPSNSQERQNAISAYRDYYQVILFTLASGKRQDLSSDEARVLTMFQGKDNPEVLHEAAASMRFQGGMRERFMRGIIRSNAYRPEMERIFGAFGLPVALTYLPHVESSFENRALSKVGAAGVWQIMPATGRRFLTVNGRVDERLDIRAATVAAAQIFQENYDHLGTWPLAITAYNHGLYGMKQAVGTMGTKDFGVIFQNYRGPSFGFASQNFYAEFLAAIEVAQNYTRYFGDIPLDSPVPFSTMVRYQRDSSSDEERNTSTTPASLPPSPLVTQHARDTSENRTTILVPDMTAARQVRESPAVEDKGSTVIASSLMARQTPETVVQEAKSSPPVLHTAVRQGRANDTKKPEDAILRAIASKAVPVAPPPAAARPAALELAMAEKAAPHVVAQATAYDAARKPAVDRTAKRPVEDATPKASASKAMPLVPAAKSATPAAPTVVAVASAPKTTMTRVAALETPRSVGASAAKGSSGKPVIPAIPIPVMLTSASRAATGKPVAAVLASSAKAAPGKSRVPEGARSVASAHASPAKLVTTRTPMPHDVPKPMLTSVTKTPVSTRATTRRPPPKGA